MHGIIRPQAIAGVEVESNLLTRLHSFLLNYNYFLLIVILPTLLVTAYYYLIASDQYESGADFVVRRADSGTGGGAGVGQLLGFDFGVSPTSSDAYLVEEYLLSHDAVRRLRSEDGLVARFRRPGTDWISRLWFESPTPEKLLSFYRDQVTIEQDADSGITHLRVHAFAPEDAYHISRKLLLLGEERINALNTRTYNDQVASSARELHEAEEALVAVQERLTSFRQLREDIDPEGSGRAQVGLATNLTGQLLAARARLQAMSSVVSRNSPQHLALSTQIRAMEEQLASQSARIAGPDKSIATTLGDYEDIVIRRDQIAKRYSAAAAQYEIAKAEANRKQLYLVRVVDANRPVKSLFPERGKIVLTFFFGLALFYLIMRLLVAGVREHHL